MASFNYYDTESLTKDDISRRLLESELEVRRLTGEIEDLKNLIRSFELDLSKSQKLINAKHKDIEIFDGLKYYCNITNGNKQWTRIYKSSVPPGSGYFNPLNFKDFELLNNVIKEQADLDIENIIERLQKQVDDGIGITDHSYAIAKSLLKENI